jgi:hypothetical protein
MKQQMSEMPNGRRTDDVDNAAFTNEQRDILFLEMPKRTVLFEPGGKRIPGLKDEVALARKIQRDLGIRLIPNTVEHRLSFMSQAHGLPPDTMMKTRCFIAMYEGVLGPTERVTKLHWDCPLIRLTEAGKQFRQCVYSLI